MLLIVASAYSNFYIWMEKNTPKQTILTQKFDKGLVNKGLKAEIEIMDKEAVEEKLFTYQNLLDQGIQNRDVYLNISQLYKLVGETDLSIKMLEKAQHI